MGPLFDKLTSQRCNKFEKMDSKVEESAVLEAEEMTKDASQNGSVAGADSSSSSAQNEEGTDITDLERKIIDQVEYYFGDINFPRDKFLSAEANKDDGWIPMSTMMKFNRLKQLSGDVEEILSALRKSETGLLEIDEAAKRIRRSAEHPLPDNTLEYWKSLKLRSVYVKGFPRTLKLDDLQKFFAPFGKPVHIMMRRLHFGDRNFKGSVFVTYSSVKECDEFLQNCPARYSEDAGMDFVKMKQEDYYAIKIRDRNQKKLDDKTAKRQKQNNAKQNNAKKSHNKCETVELKPGIILRVSNLDDTCKLKDIKKFFIGFGKVHFVSLAEGGKEADITFADGENSAQTAWDKATSAAGDGEKVKINDREIDAVVLEGETAESSWEKTKVGFQNMIDHSGGRGHRDGGRRRDGGDGGRRRDGGDGGRRRDGGKFSFKGGKQKGKRGAGDEAVPPPQAKKKRFSSDDEGEAEPKSDPKKAEETSDIPGEKRSNGDSSGEPSPKKMKPNEPSEAVETQEEKV